MDVVSLVAKPDHILSLARVSDPVRAVSELIWNGIDAEATRIDVGLTFDEIDGVQNVTVTDDGHGMNRIECLSHFGLLGGSWKATALVSPNIKRSLHGRQGQGRLRAFALGEEVQWVTIGESVTGGNEETTVRGRSTNPVDFEIRDSTATERNRGTRFESRIPAKYVNRLTRDDVRTRLVADFAVFLLANPDVEIKFRGVALDPSALWLNDTSTELEVRGDGDDSPPVLRIIEWQESVARSLSLCNEKGVELGQVVPGIQASGHNFTAYIRWRGFSDYIEVIALADLDSDDVLSGLLEEAREVLRSHFHARDLSRRRRQVSEWKDEKSYPYSAEPETAAELTERGIFDEVATTLARRLPKGRESRRTTLRLLREVVANDPENALPMVDEFFRLTKSERQDLAALLEGTSLSSIIRATTLVANRFRFLAALRTMVFDKQHRRVVKERSELHKILERETWVFGDEYSPMVSDRGLDKVLEEHLKLLGRSVETTRMTPVRREGGRRGIVDLVLGRARRTGDRQRDHLIVELKAPRVKVGPKEASQIREYAEAVTSNPQFSDPRVNWNFWVVSSELSPVVRQEADSPVTPPGCISAWGNNVRIWAKTWSEIINDCEARLEFYRECLNYEASQSEELSYFLSIHGDVAPPSISRTLNPPDGS